MFFGVEDLLFDGLDVCAPELNEFLVDFVPQVQEHFLDQLTFGVDPAQFGDQCFELLHVLYVLEQVERHPLVRLKWLILVQLHPHRVLVN